MIPDCERQCKKKHKNHHWKPIFLMYTAQHRTRFLTDLCLCLTGVLTCETPVPSKRPQKLVATLLLLISLLLYQPKESRCFGIGNSLAPKRKVLQFWSHQLLSAWQNSIKLNGLVRDKTIHITYEHINELLQLTWTFLWERWDQMDWATGIIFSTL